MPDMKSYRPMFRISNEWVGNALRFPTQEEADAQATNLMMRWLIPDAMRVDPSPEEPNYRWRDGKLIRIGEEG